MYASAVRSEGQRVQERDRGQVFELDLAPWLWGFPHHQSPLAGWYPTRSVGYLYSASSPGGLGRCIIARVARLYERRLGSRAALPTDHLILCATTLGHGAMAYKTMCIWR